MQGPRLRYADGNVVTTLLRLEPSAWDAAAGQWVLVRVALRAKCAQYTAPELGPAAHIAYIPMSPEEQVWGC